MWKFCLHSVFREYGWQFFTRVAVPHPIKTVRAVLKSALLEYDGERTIVSADQFPPALNGAQSIVGVGFCLKPITPECPSGRANHDCQFLENLPRSATPDLPAACRQCAIRDLGIRTLKSGAAFYIMTSAKDILLDLFLPGFQRQFTSGLFTLCRYSFQPFAVGLLASGIRGYLFPFQSGDCRDYKTWLSADVGVKDEQTALHSVALKNIRECLPAIARNNIRFERKGNVLYPGE